MQSLKFVKRPIILIPLILALALLHLTFNIRNTIKQEEEQELLPSSTRPSSVHINLFDLNQALEPRDIYESIQCRTSAEIFVETVLCVHDLERDVWVSASIWRDGVWERWVLTPFLEYVNKYPDWLVLDIGAQVGK